MLLCETDYDEQKHNEALKRIQPRNITQVIKEVTAIYLDLYNLTELYQINHGMCEDFAEDVCRLMPGAIALWNDEIDPNSPFAHKVILYGRKYYDCECPKGTRNWRKLMR
jgi:hypothetical protein